MDKNKLKLKRLAARYLAAQNLTDKYSKLYTELAKKTFKSRVQQNERW